MSTPKRAAQSPGWFILPPFAREDRAKVACRRLARFGFRPLHDQVKDHWLVYIPLESKSTPSQMQRDLTICCPDVVRGAQFVWPDGRLQSFEVAP